MKPITDLELRSLIWYIMAQEFDIKVPRVGAIMRAAEARGYITRRSETTTNNVQRKRPVAVTEAGVLFADGV